MMISRKMVVCIPVVMLAALLAGADYGWDFTEDLQGWRDNHEETWGSVGMTIAWEPLGDGNGMMVLTYDPVALDSTDFRPRFYMMPSYDADWNATWPDGSGGVSGRYAVIRYRAAQIEEIDQRLAFSVARRPVDGAYSTSSTKEEVQVGEWVTTVIDLPPEPADPLDRIYLQIGNRDVGPDNDRAFFENGGRIEIDFIRFVDDPTPYLTWTFDGEPMTWRVGPSLLWSFIMGYINPTIWDGKLNVIASDDPNDLFGGAAFIGGLINEHVHLRTTNLDSLHMHVRMRVNADPGYDSADMELIWNEGGAEWSGPSFDNSDAVWLTIPTNEWVHADFAISDASGYAQDVGGLYDGLANQWVFIFGIDRDASWPVFPELQSVDFDYITFSPYPGDLDSDGDGIPDYREIAIYGTDPTDPDTDGDGLSDYDEIYVHGTDPLNPDTSGNGIPDGWLVGYGLDPLDPDIAGQDLDGDGYTVYEEYLAGTDPLDPDSNPGEEEPPPPPVPLAGGTALALTALALSGLLATRAARTKS